MNLENVGNSVWNSVRDSVWFSVEGPVSPVGPVGGSVNGPVDDSVRVSAVQEIKRHLKERI